MDSVPARSVAVPSVLLGHPADTFLADTVGGIALALVVFALYYYLVLQRVQDR